MLGTGLSEFHSGYRAYSVPCLAGIPFEFNTNDFHFDTEIILQFLAAEYRVREVPIPTYYGDEICHVNGLKYAAQVVVATLKYRMHGLGLLQQRNFDIVGGVDVYHTKLGYSSSHTYAIAAVPDGQSVLDLACGLRAGVAGELRKKGCHVIGVDRVAAAPENLDRVYRLDLNRDELPSEVADVDTILLLDIIEHLEDPESFMLILRRRSAAGTRVVLTTANVAFIVIRLMLLLGKFNYGPRGILDKTHTRLFTFGSMRRLLEQCGYRIEEVRGIPAPFPEAVGKPLSSLLLFLNRVAIRIWRSLFSYQIFMVVRPIPTVDRLLRRTQEHTASLDEV
jgi:SAM-dependent methyltransferase